MSNQDNWEVREAANPPARSAGWRNSIVGMLGLVLASILVGWSSSEATESAPIESSVRPLTVIRWPQSPVFNIAWSPDGRRLAASSFGPVIRVWDRDSGMVSSHEGGTEQPRFAVGWSMDGRQLMVSGLDQPIESWDLDSQKGLNGPKVARPSGLAESVGDLSRTSRARPIRVWGMDEKRFGPRVNSREGANSIAFSSDGSYYATGGLPGRLEIHHAKSGELRRSIQVDRLGITGVTFSSDSTKVGTSGPGPARIWDVESGRELARFGDEQFGSTTLGFAGDGSRIAVALWDGSIQVWDLTTRQEVCRLRGHQGSVLSLDWSPDGKTLASCGYDTTVRVWDLTAPGSKRASD